MFQDARYKSLTRNDPVACIGNSLLTQEFLFISYILRSRVKFVFTLTDEWFFHYKKKESQLKFKLSDDL